MSTLHNVVVAAEKEEVARGIRLLLRRPLITAKADPDSFDLLRRRAGPISLWFDYNCGWAMVSEPRLGYLRLVKVGVGGGQDATRPARRVRDEKVPFDRRTYILLCVVAAEVLLTLVTTIGILADRVTQACLLDPVLPDFDSSVRRQRVALVDVIALLESFSVLTSTDGSTGAFVDTPDAKVLYMVDGALLVRLLATTTGPSHLAVPADEIPRRFDELVRSLMIEPRYGETDPEHASGFAASDSQRNLWLRHSILRRLFDEPVVYRAELSQGQRDYLASITGRRILRNAVEQAGFELEERAEGWLLVDRDALATDSKFPDGSSTKKTAALVLLGWLVDQQAGVTTLELYGAAQNILDKAPGWAKTYRSTAGAERLATDAAEVLVDFKLAQWQQDRLLLLPAAARYRSAVVSRDDVDISGGLW